MCRAIAIQLRIERERQHLTLEALAQRAGLSRQMVSYVEQGARTPTIETLLRMTAALGVALEDLIRDARRDGGSGG